ncbi:hypothetical protein [Stenotrophomonas maltophilia]|uniref:hypothetical protein n=1 Tax=Stenotrophomonas maltophilia TaxID=40324 RepID=UPI001140C7D0|nr:hypothetical protein [Stenotrophomonas maltophilia]
MNIQGTNQLGSSTLSAHIRTAAESLQAFQGVRKADRNSLAAVMKGANNIVSDLSLKLKDARSCSRSQHLALKEMFKSAQNIRSVGDDTTLRLKGGQIKPQASGSMLKNLLGIGKAGRNAQVTALAERSGGATTRTQLREAYRQAKAEDVAVTDVTFAKNDRPLQQAIRDLLTFTHLPDRRDKMEAAIRAQVTEEYQDIRAALLRSVGSNGSQSGLTSSFEAFCRLVKEDHSDVMQSQTDNLRGRLSSLEYEAKRLQHEAAVTQRRAAVAELLDGYRKPPLREVKRMTAELKVLKGGQAFDIVWSTNKGCRALTEMSRGARSSLSGDTIISEIKKRHGDDAFNGGAKAVGQDVKYYASALTPSDVDHIASINHGLSLVRYLEGAPSHTTYRQAMHSSGIIGLLKSMAGTGEVIRPEQFMATADRREDTLKYPVSSYGGLDKVQFKISGFSGMWVNSPYNYAGEGPEYIYTNSSAFRVVSFTMGNGAYQVELEEVPASKEALSSARVLGL